MMAHDRSLDVPADIVIVPADVVPAAGRGPEFERPALPGRLAAAFGISLFAAALVGILVESTYDHFKIPPDILARAERASPTSEETQAFQQASRRVRLQNAILLFGLFGAVVGGLFGAGDGLLRRSRTELLTGLARGISVGAACGVPAGWASVVIESLLYNHKELDFSQKAMAAHAAAWVISGLGVGLAASWGTRNRSAILQTVILTAAAGLLSAMLFLPVAGILFPLGNADHVIPRGCAVRLVMVHLSAVLMGIAVGLSRRRQSTPAGR